MEPNRYPRIAVRVSPEMRERLEAIAEADRATLGAVVKQALRQYIEQREAAQEAAQAQ